MTVKERRAYSAGDATDPTGPVGERLLFRTTRWGRFDASPMYITSGAREREVLSARNPIYGFRAARTITP
jgi:hypothetical protein